MADLIGIEYARRRVLEAVEPLPGEPLVAGEALGRVLADEVASGVDVPPFDSSAMDGYAVVAGPEGERRVVDESRAGHPAEASVEGATAVAISTGARLPAGSDAVVPVERVEVRQDTVVVPEIRPGANVRRAGEDVRAGAVVLRAGTALGPAELGVIASLGRREVRCARRPRLALIVTGDELAGPGEALGPGEIWSSNDVALAAQASLAGAAVVSGEVVPDEPRATRDALSRALERADLVCVSGGVSVGPHDHVKGALGDLGVEERFWGVRLKPGKPTWFGARAGVLVLGLPGNPVSAMVTFHLFARPALRALQGADPGDLRGFATLEEPLARNPGREQAVRVRLRAAEDGWRAAPTGPQGSHQLTSMLGADALALVPQGEGELAAGARVEVDLLERGYWAA